MRRVFVRMAPEVKLMAYADDIVIVAEDRPALALAVQALVEECVG